MLVSKHSDLIALSFLTVVWVIHILGLTPVNSSGVETTASSIITLRFFLSSHLPACWDIFLCYPKVCVQQKACFSMIGQYQ